MTIGHSGFLTETEWSVCQTITDLLVIGTQECLNETKEWESRLQGTLGPSHVMFHSHHLGTIHIAIFIRRDLVRLWLPIDRKNSAGSACCVSVVQNILGEQNEFFSSVARGSLDIWWIVLAWLSICSWESNPLPTSCGKSRLTSEATGG